MRAEWSVLLSKKHAERDDMAATYLCNSSVRGYNVFQSVWSAEEGENLVCKWEMSNPARQLRRHCSKKLTDRSVLANLRSLFICYGPRVRVFALASRFSADKTFRLACRIARGGLWSESGPIGSGRWPLTDLK